MQKIIKWMVAVPLLSSFMVLLNNMEVIKKFMEHGTPER